MKSFSDYVAAQNEIATVDSEWWGHEISGTVAEVIEKLKTVPQNWECVAAAMNGQKKRQMPPPTQLQSNVNARLDSLHRF